MHYRVRGIEIRSENAAKSMLEASGPLVSWLNDRNHVRSALDCGCGKLRYATHIANRCSILGIVDSRVQLDRNQRIDGVVTSVRKYAREKWPKCKIYDLESFWRGIPEVYDFVLCANVLSVIPSTSIRAKSLHAIHSSLARQGEALFVNQHTNSYFGEVKAKPNSFEHLDGRVVQSSTGGSYYGVLNKDSVARLLKRFDFVIKEAWIDGQSNYVLASKR